MNQPVFKDDFYSEHVILDPLEQLGEARRKHPVFRTKMRNGLEVYVVTTYDLIKDVFSRPEDFSNDYAQILRPDTGNIEVDRIIAETGFDYAKYGSFLLTTDEPEHKRRRDLVAPAFTVGMVNRLNDQLTRHADELIDSFIEGGECDLVQEFAVPYTLGAILSMIGVDTKLVPRAYEWTSAAARRIGQSVNPEQELNDARAVAEMIRFLQDYVGKVRANPSDDFVSRVLGSSVTGGVPLTDDEAVSFLHEMILGGTDTTRSAIVAMIGLLLRNPEQMRRVLADRSLIPTVVEETMRHHSPAVAIWRIAARNTEIGGITIPKGAAVNLRLDSANRDEATFENADAFDAGRKKARVNLTMGYGLHFCIGNLLARKEAAIALTRLLDRLDGMKIIEERSDLRRNYHVLAHSLRALAISFKPGARLNAG